MAGEPTGIFYMGANRPAATEFPKDLRSGGFRRWDRPFLIVLGITAVVLGTLTAILSLLPVSDTVSEKEILRIQERYAQLVLNEPVPVKPEVVEETAGSESAVQEEAGGEVEEEVDRANESFEEKQERKQASSDDRRARRAQVAQQVQSSGIFAAITSAGGSGAASGAESFDFLGGAEGGVGDLAGVDIGKGSFATRKSDGRAEGLSRRGEKTTGVGIQRRSVGAAGGKQLASTGKVNVSSKPPEIKTESGGVVTSRACIQRVIHREKRRIHRVYENWLKRDPALSGQISVKFNILPGGGISNVSIVRSSTGNDDFDRNVLRYIGRWSFESCEITEATEIVLPFAFEEAG